MKKTFTVILALVMGLSLCACQIAEEKDQLTFGLVLRSEEPYQKKIEEGFRQAADALGVETITGYADGTAETQIGIIEDMISKGVQGIAISAADPNALEETLEEAKDAGIAVVTVDADTAGSEVFINQANTMEVARALLDTILELTGGEGQFAVIASGLFSGSNVWISALEQLHREEKYEELVWAETMYNDGGAADVLELTSRYPELEVICCPDATILLSCCQALENSGTALKVTGLGRPSWMAEYVGEDKICPYMYLWNPTKMGECAVYALDGLLTGEIGEAGTSFTGKNGVTYSIANGLPAEKMLLMGAPFRFDGENIQQWAEIY